MDKFIGLMSGTSMDGIDAVLMTHPGQSLLFSKTYPWPKAIHERILLISSGALLNVVEFARFERELAMVFADVVMKLLSESKTEPYEVRAIGLHGQTMAHDLNHDIPVTIQMGCAHTLTALTGIKVVADFRCADVAAGGQGAPLAPLYHRYLLDAHLHDSAVVNIGGIANVSLVNDGVLMGFDTGPGNGLLDAWISSALGLDYDENGLYAAKGECITPLLDDMLNHSFFKKQPPKSLDKYDFSLSWLKRFNINQYRPEDIQNTLTHLTAKAILNTVLQYPHIKNIYICGGGCHNHYLMSLLNSRDIKAIPINQLDYDADFIEAMMCAWLAATRLEGQKHDTTAITGAKNPVYLGVLYE